MLPFSGGFRGREDLGPPAILISAVSKIGTVLSLLQRDEGATLVEMVTATGWLPQTARAASYAAEKELST